MHPLARKLGRPLAHPVWVVLAVCPLMAAGCSYGFSVRKAEGPDLIAAWRDSMIEDDRMSPRTLQTLRRLDLEATFQRNPLVVCSKLHELVLQDPDPDMLFALAETNYLLGRLAEEHDCHQASGFYYLCAGYAYHYLFPMEKKAHPDEPQIGMPDPFAPRPFPLAAVSEEIFDPRFRLACDLYNLALSKCIRAAQEGGRLDPREKLHLLGGDGQSYDLSVVHHGFPWKPEEFGPLLFCDDYQAVGFANHYRGYGLGVPLIATRLPGPAGERAPGQAFYPSEVSFPVTAFFRFKGTLEDLYARRAGRLELYNPLDVQTVRVQGKPVPLETDLTTPLAYFLSRSNLDAIRYTGFLRVDQAQERTGIYMFEPYEPGKIPVLMIHGLLGSPLTWAPMFNDLRADPLLRKHFQFWFYLYPTGNPYLVTAADLRQSLNRLRDELDPKHCDPALEQMVFVGHSMGGLIAKLCAVDSGDEYWRLVSPEPFANVKAQPETREEIRRVFFFERQPFVRRVVFLATPHHGSKFSPSLPGRLAVKFVRLPNHLMQVARDFATENPEVWPDLAAGRIPTSVDLLAPGSPALVQLAASPKPREVHYHSIIGDVYDAGPDGGDGVVLYRSAHVDDADSELVIHADHAHVHHHPRAVLAVRDLLLEHLRSAPR